MEEKVVSIKFGPAKVKVAKSLTPQQAKALETIPESKRGIAKKAYEGTATLRQMTKAKCNECCNYENLAVVVTECAISTCPVWRYRPGAPK